MPDTFTGLYDCQKCGARSALSGPAGCQEVADDQQCGGQLVPVPGVG